MQAPPRCNETSLRIGIKGSGHRAETEVDGVWVIRRSTGDDNLVFLRMTAGFILVTIVAGGASLVLAQERLDLTRYGLTIPVGWSSTIEGEHWKLYPTGGENELGMVPVGNGLSIGPTLTHADAHRQLWATALGSHRVLQANPTQEQKGDDGRTWLIDSAAIDAGGVPYLLIVSMVELDGRAEGFLVLGTPQAIERHQQAIDSILNSVRPRGMPSAVLTRTRDKVPVFGQPSPLGAPRPNRLAGVWTATTHELQIGMSGLANKPSVSELILFADGSALWGMPGEGLLGFDRTAHRARSPERWGTYQLKDKRLTIMRGREARQYIVLPDGALENRYAEGGQERTGEKFLLRPSLDNVRLDGEVRRKDHWPAPGNTRGIGTLPGLTFSKDGTFRDEKLLWIVLPERTGEDKTAHEARVAPGTGRYRFEHWTLVLEYDDGRVNQVSFVPTDRKHPIKAAILNGYPIEPKPY